NARFILFVLGFLNPADVFWKDTSTGKVHDIILFFLNLFFHLLTCAGLKLLKIEEYSAICFAKQ
ncbi:MAG: hypothetical protein JXR61_12885, partial [Prolixibacteraceae bacterium]|nr:hypothetical protein [Prolixibacteraceae bacterium]